MKKSLLVLLIAFTATLVSAQRNRTNQLPNDTETITFDRKGRILVETGYNLFGGIPIGGGTGLIVLTDGDSTASGLGLNIGYFVSQNFALKFGYSNLSSDGSGISTYAVGGKYYIAGFVPIEASLGTFSAGGDSDLFAKTSIGYGIRLADNINLEPSLGLFMDGDQANITFGVNFAMFL